MATEKTLTLHACGAVESKGRVQTRRVCVTCCYKQSQPGTALLLFFFTQPTLQLHLFHTNASRSDLEDYEPFYPREVFSMPVWGFRVFGATAGWRGDPTYGTPPRNLRERR
jgi:hypothetical protein